MALFPSSPAPDSLSLSSYFPSTVSKDHNGGRYIRIIDGHRWAISLGFSRLEADDFRPLQAFVDSQEGKYGSFTYVVPGTEVPRGTALGTPKVSGSNQTGTSLLLQDCTADQVAFLKAGDIFTINLDTKVYTITANIASDSIGEALIKFRPALRKIPAALAAVTLHDVVFTVQLAKAEQVYGVRSPLLFSKQMNLLEVV